MFFVFKPIEFTNNSYAFFILSNLLSLSMEKNLPITVANLPVVLIMCSSISLRYVIDE